jgi:hypothetical protein
LQAVQIYPLSCLSAAKVTPFAGTAQRAAKNLQEKTRRRSVKPEPENGVFRARKMKTDFQRVYPAREQGKN